MTVLLRDVKQSQISEDELKLLLGYVEEDIHDYRRQVTAFPLLKVSFILLFLVLNFNVVVVVVYYLNNRLF